MGQCAGKQPNSLDSDNSNKNANENANNTYTNNTAPTLQRPLPTPVKSVLALFDYDAAQDGDLSFKKGDRMNVIGDTEQQDWWLAEHAITKTKGYIPSNYVAEFKNDKNDIETEEWFFNITRQEAERLMLPPGHLRGTFLVRVSADGAYALTIRDVDERGPTVKHYKIRVADENSLFFISARRKFSTLRELVYHYKNQDDGLCHRLIKACPREKPPIAFRDLKINRKQIELQKKLGAGNFGEVWQGKWKTLGVAVKTLKEGTMKSEQFLDEAKVMHKLQHPHLVQLYAISVDDGPLWLITELMAKGALLDLLREDCDEPRQITFQRIVDFLTQIADGMNYLEEHQVVHRDLRAANVLCDNDYTVKVADFGLARLVEDDEVYETSSENAKFPVKWTAPEAAHERKFTTKSDVWSFGILIYELITYGRVPYVGMTNRAVLEQLEKGYRMPKPNSQFECPDSLYDLQMQCWSRNPASRPTFEFLHSFFEDYFQSTEPNYRVTADM